ncbi:hypothetical protein IPP75_04085 [Candidatus Saccharibacteria bacterium]|nr:MAG: hypothetical protein IPP75_04085 [Candidatus Saccharibacteria bacterium]
MFNQSGRNAFSPSNQPRRMPSQPSPASSTTKGFGAQIRPDFMQASRPSATGQPPAHMQRIKSDGFQTMSPQSQRAALFDQARQQAKQSFQSNYQSHTGVSGPLPGGLTERQRMDFETLKRTNPLAAEKQLQIYQQNSDIRYNKPGTTPQPPTSSGLTYRRPPTSFNGPRRPFGK